MKTQVIFSRSAETSGKPESFNKLNVVTAVLAIVFLEKFFD